MKINVDMHCHSEYSHDSKLDIVSLLDAQLKNRITTVALTDHCDFHLSTDIDAYENATRGLTQAIKIAEEYKNFIFIKGIELGESIWYPKIAHKITSEYDFDVILSSVHAVRSVKSCIPYSLIDFSTWTLSETEQYILCYFNDIEEMIDTINFDILTHLICPLKYISVQIDLELYKNHIERILKKIIKKKIALEINTSDKELLFKFKPILQIYLDLGGKLLTIGSDAHKSESIVQNFDVAEDILSSLGIDELYYYKNRKPIKLKLTEV